MSKLKPATLLVPGLMLLVLVTVALAPLAAGDDDLSFFSEEPLESLVKVSSVFSRTSVAPGQSHAAATIATISPGWHINSAKPRQKWLIAARLEFDTIPGLTPHSVVYPPGNDVTLGEELTSVYDGRVVVRFEVDVAGDLAPGNYQLPVHFTFQPCNDRECRAPETVSIPLEIAVGTEGEVTDAGLFGSPPTAAEQATAATGDEGGDIGRLIRDHGVWGYFIALGLAFVTGLLLSFSPCTYPMIPITVSVFAGQERSVGRGFFLSLIYVGSMAVVYGIMGLIVSLVGGVFGAWLASPAVVIGIAVVFVIFSLSMFGLYELQVPNWLRQKLGARQSGGGGIGGVVVLGIVAALVVSPCVGPFVAGILLYVATSGSPVIGFLVLFVFALGLGTLYVIIATFSSAINALPGSGGWMESVKKFFGFVLLVMAVYFLRTIIPPAVTAIVTGLILLAFGVFGGGLDRLTPESGFFLRLKKFLGTLALLFAVYLLGGTLLTQGVILEPASRWLPTAGSASAVAETELIDWEHSLETGLTRARQEAKPVLIDTWATWCANCRVLEKKTFGHPEVAAEAERFVAIKVQLETAGSAETRGFMQRFGLKHYSLPTTLLLDSSGGVRRIIPGLIGPDDMLTAMREVD